MRHFESQFGLNIDSIRNMNPFKKSHSDKNITSPDRFYSFGGKSVPNDIKNFDMHGSTGNLKTIEKNIEDIKKEREEHINTVKANYVNTADTNMDEKQTVSKTKKYALMNQI